MKPYQDPKTLRYLYWDKEMNQIEIAQEFDVCKHTIYNWMKRLGIPARDTALAHHLCLRNNVNLSGEAISFLSGCQLGDGSIERKNVYSARYRHGSKYKEYLKWLIQQLSIYGLEMVGSICRQVHITRGKRCIDYHFKTRCYAELLPLWKKWYSSGKKQPPHDLILDGLALRQWYIGDGYYREKRCPRSIWREVRLCNYAFSEKSRLFLIGLFNNLGIQASSNKAGINILTRSMPKFFDLIGPCPVPDIYGYKWPTMELDKHQDQF